MNENVNILRRWYKRALSSSFVFLRTHATCRARARLEDGGESQSGSDGHVKENTEYIVKVGNLAIFHEKSLLPPLSFALLNFFFSLGLSF